MYPTLMAEYGCLDKLDCDTLLLWCGRVPFASRDAVSCETPRSSILHVVSTVNMCTGSELCCSALCWHVVCPICMLTLSAVAPYISFQGAPVAPIEIFLKFVSFSLLHVRPHAYEDACECLPLQRRFHVIGRGCIIVLAQTSVSAQAHRIAL